MKHTVIIYSTPTCTYCNDAKAFFKKHEVEFTDYDVSKDATRREEMIAKTQSLAVPVIVIDGVGTIGFDKEDCVQKLGLEI